MTCLLTLDPAPRALALLHAALVHAGPAVALLQVLVAGLVEAYLWEPHRVSLLWAHHCPVQPPCMRRVPLLPGPAAPRPRSPVPQSLPVKPTGQVQWWEPGSWVLVQEPPLRQGLEAQGSRAAGDVQKRG